MFIVLRGTTFICTLTFTVVCFIHSSLHPQNLCDVSYILYRIIIILIVTTTTTTIIIIIIIIIITIMITIMIIIIVSKYHTSE